MMRLSADGIFAAGSGWERISVLGFEEEKVVLVRVFRRGGWKNCS